MPNKNPKVNVYEISIQVRVLDKTIIRRWKHSIA